jgi:sec-independent protein translocase protein TatB
MFDIAFSELVIIGVVALVVLGPERLPKVARTAGHLFGRLQRYVATVKADLNREMEFSELSKVKQEVQEAARAFEQSAQQHAQSIESEAREVGAALESPLPHEPAAAPSTEQTDMLAAQEQGMADDGDASVPSTASDAIQTICPARTVVTSAAAGSQQGTLDFGIEPVRGSRG